MEFPDLGAHCHEKTCNRLDFLPMKCDACSYIFCNNHVQYSKHDCEKAYEKDVQVPICPLCNQPVPTKRGQLPDLEVEQHILRDCVADPSSGKRQVYSNKCSMKNCKQKELIPVTCTLCGKNYCLKHRHATDHNCIDPLSGARAMSQAGAAALARAQNFKHPPSQTNYYGNQNIAAYNDAGGSRRQPEELSEDEALALAIRQSLMDMDNSSSGQKCKALQEKEDRLLAEALVASEKDASKQLKQSKEKNCTIS